MVEAKVIVIEPSDLEANALQALLHFLDLESVVIRDLAELRAFFIDQESGDIDRYHDL